MNCRFCQHGLNKKFVNLGMTPLANSYLKEKELEKPEVFYPLEAYVCEKCLLVQIGDSEKPQGIFSEYAYFSSFSKTWLNHVENFSRHVIEKFEINKNSKIIEIASNDGYLLKYFKHKKIPSLGIEPAKNIAQVANKKGIKTLNAFFTYELAKELSRKGNKADLLIVFNVLPHIPKLNDFIRGLKTILAKDGILVIQFSAYLLDLIKKNEFDTVYHEHFSYFSLLSIKKILEKFNLKIFDLSHETIHGGSLRIFVTHSNNKRSTTVNVSNQIQLEKKFGLDKISTYTEFSHKIPIIKNDIWSFFIKMKKAKKDVVCYGAPAKGNTLLNYVGVGTDFIDYTVDISPHKQGLYLPGTHIPIFSPDKIRKTKPDYVIILPWNLKDEIIKQISFIRNWGGKFVIFVPKVRVIN